jgi:hypothetical protein
MCRSEGGGERFSKGSQFVQAGSASRGLDVSMGVDIWD